uniref:LRRCT domain-containing protein n=1 Tax=Panagrellus redivivus TaxID=6233 RepID=A0A7E4W9C2_PANRE
MKALLFFAFAIVHISHSTAGKSYFGTYDQVSSGFGHHFVGFEGYTDKIVDSLDYFCRSDAVYRLEKLPMKLLRVLSLTSCGITELADDAFEKVADSLEELNLSGSMIREFPDLSKFTKLTKLVLNHYLIGDFLDEMSRRNESIGIKHLELANTGLTELTKSSFSRFKNLKTLDISYNPNLRIAPDAFSSLNLENLNMNANGLTTLPLEVFNSIPTLTTLSLNGNKFVKLPQNGFESLPNLTFLSLKFNRLENLSIDAFNGLNSLKHLDLSHNRFTDLQPGIFDNLTRLETLDLSHNALTKIQTKSFSQINNWSRILLNNNQIDEISQNALPPLEKVKTLINLGSNKLTTLAIDSFLPLENSTEVRRYNGEDDFKIILSGNQLICNKKLAWLVKSYQPRPDPHQPDENFLSLMTSLKGKKYVRMLPPIDDPTCTAPEVYADNKLVEIQFE